MEKDMETLTDKRLQKYAVQIEPLAKAGTQVELKRILKGPEPASKPVFSLDDLDIEVSHYVVRRIKLDLEPSERRKKHLQAARPTAYASPASEREALPKTRYEDDRGVWFTVWWYKIGDTITSSMKDFACGKLAEYDWLDDIILIIVPDFDESLASRHIKKACQVSRRKLSLEVTRLLAHSTRFLSFRQSKIYRYVFTSMAC